jgi:DNA-binding transcriptional ArsR family regulator
VADGVGPVFDALGDPGRRDLMQAIAQRGSATATELAAERDVTRQAVSKQLGTLADAGLLRSRREGRETRYEVATDRLRDAVGWMTDVGAAWDDRLMALRTHLGRRRR